MNILIDILIMIVILGVLISLHELGHFGMAKSFKVYCFEYSIGFGPKLLHIKRKNGETYFSLRAIPLGGYVSMYGEEGAVPEGVEEPPKERSLSAKPKYQQALIMGAGVTVNYILGLLLLWVSASCFKNYYIGYSYQAGTSDQTVTSLAMPAHWEGEAQKEFQESAPAGASSSDYLLFGGAFIDSDGDGQQDSYLLPGSVSIQDVPADAVQGVYVVTYSPSTLTKAHSFTSSLHFYHPDETKEVPEALKQIGIRNYPNVKGGYFSLKEEKEDGHFSLELPFTALPKKLPVSQEKRSDALVWENRVEGKIALVNQGSSWRVKEGDGYVKDGLTVDTLSARLSLKEAWSSWCRLVPQANKAIFQGLASLFTSGLKNVSGIIGMTAQVSTVRAMGGAASIFLYAGIISINLAIFNLLPFPGLDGWQLLVLVVEAITRPKISTKVKSIVSYVGLGLLFVLAIAIMVKDIIGVIR